MYHYIPSKPALGSLSPSYSLILTSYLKFEHPLGGHNEPDSNFGLACLLEAGVQERRVVVKRLRVEDDVTSKADSSKSARNLTRSLQISTLLSHPNILAPLGYWLNGRDETPWTVLPFLPNGNIRSFLRNSKVSAEDRLRKAIDTAAGLDFLHSLRIPICHGDLKPENVLVMPNLTAVLTDFGLRPESNSHVTDVRFSSPDLMSVNACGPSLEKDIWAWGCLILEILTDRLPYRGHGAIGHVLIAMTNGVKPAPVDDLPVPNSIRTLLNECWEFWPAARPSIHECLDVLLQEAGLPRLPQRQSDLEKRLSRVQEISGLTLKTDPVDAEPFQKGGNAELFEAIWHPTADECIEVAIKCVTTIMRSPLERETQFYREMTIWGSLRHPRITPLLGYMRRGNALFPGCPGFVSPLRKNGNLYEYISKDPQADRLKLLIQVADGLTYLHSRSPPILHLDIRPDNILINDEGDAELCDFGLAQVLRDPNHQESPFAREPPTTDMNYSSPEMLEPDDFPLTPASDVYVFGRLILKILSGSPAYYAEKAFSRKKAHIIHGVRISRVDHPIPGPPDLVDALWSLMESCWKLDPAERPSSATVLGFCRRFFPPPT